jgi:hypothetical protein
MSELSTWEETVTLEVWVPDALMDFIDAFAVDGGALLPYQAEAYREACRAITGHACTCELPVFDN